jgi:hypothetical protein
MALPSGYTRLEYIESTSDSAGAGEQYIDTEVIPSTNDFSVVMKASARVIDAENWFLTINRQMPVGTATYLQFGIRGNSTFATHLTYVAIDGTTAATSDIVDITFSVQGNTATQSGDATHTMTAAELQSGSYRNSTITIVNGNWRCYSCQIYLGDALVRDFVPCKTADDEVGLYDIVNGAFYENKGSGEFTAGAVVSYEYKVVNATMLDSAIGATADAIRTKTGGTAGIPWNESTGFASEISAIAAGGKVAIGEFTRAGNFYVEFNDNPVTITGLGFKPTRVIVFLDLTTEKSSYACWERRVLVSADSESGMVFQESAYYEEDDTEEVYLMGGGHVDFVFTSDGFTMSGESYVYLVASRTYRYIAIG